MEITITSWAIAVLLVSLPLAALGVAMGRYDTQTKESFSTREDLLAHVNNSGMDNFWVCWLLVVLLGGAYVSAVALVAWWLQRLALEWSSLGGL